MEGRCLAPRYGRKAVIFVIWASGEEACVRRLFPGRIAVAKRQSAFWIQKWHGVNRPSVHVVPHSCAQTSLTVLAIGAREEKATAHARHRPYGACEHSMFAGQRLSSHRRAPSIANGGCTRSENLAREPVYSHKHGVMAWQWDAASDARIGAADPRSAARFEESEASADDRRRRGPSRYACSPTLRHLVPAELAVRVSAGSSAAPQGFALQISRIRWLLPPANVGFAQNRRTATARQQTLS